MAACAVIMTEKCKWRGGKVGPVAQHPKSESEVALASKG